MAGLGGGRSKWDEAMAKVAKEFERAASKEARDRQRAAEQAAKDRDREARRWRDGMRQFGGSLMDVTRALIPIPTSLGQFVRQTQQVTGSGGAMSTLSQSFQLVMMQMAGVFLPAIVMAARGLQDFARWLEGVSESKDPVDKELREFERSRLGGDFSGMMSAFARANVRGILQGVPQMFRYGLIGTEKEVLRQHAVGYGGARMADDKEFQLARLLDAAAQPMRMVGEAMRDARRVTQRQDAARASGRAGGGTGDGPDAARAGGRGLLTDALPPGYHARFLGFEEAHRQLQLTALQTTPLDVELNRQSLKQLQRLVQLAEEDRQQSNPIPSPTTRKN